MIRIILDATDGIDVPLDKCDMASLQGIVRDALLASERLREFAGFRMIDEFTIVYPTWERDNVDRTPIAGAVRPTS